MSTSSAKPDFMSSVPSNNMMGPPYCKVGVISSALFIIIGFGVLFGTWSLLGQTGLALHFKALILTGEGVALCAVIGFGALIVLAIFREKALKNYGRALDQWNREMSDLKIPKDIIRECRDQITDDLHNKNFDPTFQKYSQNAQTLHQEKIEDQKAIRKENKEIVRAFCKGIFKNIDPRIASLLTALSLCEAKKWESLISEERNPFLGPSTYRTYSRFKQKGAPPLVQKLELYLAAPLACAEVINKLEQDIETEAILKGLMHILYVPKDLRWKNIDLFSSTAHSMDMADQEGQGRKMIPISVDDILSLSKHLIFQKNQQTYRIFRKRVVDDLQKLDRKLLEFLKVNFLEEKEKSVKKKCASGLLIVNLKEEWSEYQTLLREWIYLFHVKNPEKK